MELDVTKLCRAWLAESDDVNPASDYSCSPMEKGDYAGPGSWQAAVDDAGLYFTLAPDEIAAVRDHFRDYGAWTDAEIAAWSTADVHALALQEVAAAWRETMEGPDAPTNLAEFEAATRDNGGRLCPTGDDFATCEWYFYFGT